MSVVAALGSKGLSGDPEAIFQFCTLPADYRGISGGPAWTRTRDLFLIRDRSGCHTCSLLPKIRIPKLICVLGLLAFAILGARQIFRGGVRTQRCNRPSSRPTPSTPRFAKWLWEILLPHLERTRRSLVCLLTLRCCLGTQPQRDVGGLHRVPYYPYKVAAQSIEVCLVSELGREGF
jgi:hypothetical protein